MSQETLVEDLDVGQIEMENKLMQMAGPFRSKIRSICPYGCNKILAERTLQYHKTNGCNTKRFAIPPESTRKPNQFCGVCYAEFSNRASFFDHLSIEHNVNARINKKLFPTRAMFDRFLRWLEKEGGAHFRTKSGSKNNTAIRTISLSCNRSGSCSTKGRFDAASMKNKTGPFRVGYTCTAFVHGTEYPDGMVCIEFCGDHYGHDARMRLPNIAKQLIAQQQLNGEPAAAILTYLHRQFSPLAVENVHAQRICMVDPDELRLVMTMCTRKWEDTGIPMECEIWEEELLDAAGIVRRGIERVRPLTEKTTDQLAEELGWERPLIFNAHLKTQIGDVVLSELKSSSADAREDIATVTKCIEYAESKAKQEQLVDVESVEEGEVIIDRGGARAAVLNATNVPKKDVLIKADLLTAICTDIHALDKMVRFDSAQMNGACLVAFTTRVRALLSAYKSTINRGAPKFASDAAVQTTNELQGEVKKEVGQGNSVMASSDDEERLFSGIKGVSFNSSLWT